VVVVLTFCTSPGTGNFEIADILNGELGRMTDDNGIEEVGSACETDRS